MIDKRRSSATTRTSPKAVSSTPKVVSSAPKVVSSARKLARTTIPQRAKTNFLKPNLRNALKDIVIIPSSPASNALQAAGREEFTLRLIRSRAIRDHHQHKNRWSWFLMTLLAGMICFQMVLITMVGLGKWDFTHYGWLLPVLMVQYLLQIVALAMIVVRHFFAAQGPTQPLSHEHEEN